MASVKIKNLKNISANFKKFLEDKIINNKQMMDEIGKLVVNDIKANARSGKSPKTNKKFPNLSKEWMEERDYLLQYNAADEFFLGSDKSNVTFTGEFLDSIEHKITDAGEVTIAAAGNHSGYKTKSGQTKSLTNKLLAKYLADQGRVVIAFRDKIKSRINVIVRSTIRREIINLKK